MNNSIKKAYCLIAVAAVALAAMTVSGCGGGGNGETKKQAAPGHGFVSARIVLKNLAAGKASFAGRVAAVASDTVEISLSIEGVYSENKEQFPPVLTTIQIDPSVGYAKATIPEVPIGVNHLLTAVAKWPGGRTATVKCVVKKVTEGETTQAIADEASTIVADAAIEAASLEGTTLSELPSETIVSLESAVATILSQGIPVGSVTVAQALDVKGRGSVAVASIDVAPASATVTVGEQQQYSAVAHDGFGHALPNANVTWSVTYGLGSMSSSGLLAASGVGTGAVTATAIGISGTSALTVAAVCSAHSDCDDSNASTLDSCYSPGTTEAVCAHSTSGCNTSSDCGQSLPVCINGGTANSFCIACGSNANCNDSNALTIDACVNPGVELSACTHTAIACNTSDNCGSTAPVCVSGGTVSSVCIVCSANLDCNDNNALTTDTCSYGGTTQSICSHYNSNTVRGTITSGGQPVADAVVRLYNNTYDHTIRTDSLGHYIFTDVPFGNYSITVTKGGMTLQSASVTVGPNQT